MFFVIIHSLSLFGFSPWDRRQACLSGCHLPCLRPDSLHILLTFSPPRLWQAWEFARLRDGRNFLSFSSAFWDINQRRKQTKYFFFLSCGSHSQPIFWSLIWCKRYQPVWTPHELGGDMLHTGGSSTSNSLPYADNGAGVRGRGMKVKGNTSQG